MAVENSLLENLNNPQREAVLHGEGPLLVLAGAGSGKTRVLTSRVASLVQRGAAEGYEITALTFTNKAAGEMRERASRLSGGRLRGAFLGTFHRWALEILRRWPKEAGLKPRFSILDADDQRAVMRRLIKAEQLDPKEYPSRMVLARISAEVNKLHDLEDMERRSGPVNANISRLWKAYEGRKKELAAVDFDDMLSLCLKLLRSNKAVLSVVRRRSRYLLVDEFQDTNKVQMELLHTILGKEGNITAVGDEDQSIYRWRGAEMQNILKFERHFPGARVVLLEENYRSTEAILALSGALISQNTMRRGKTLFTKLSGGEPIRLFVAADEREEARWTVDEIEKLGEEFARSEMVVLLRTNAQTRPYEEELTRRNIPYRVVGGLRFWQRAEVKDALAYLRLVIRPDDVVAFERVVNLPARGIGAATLDILRRHAERTGLPLPAAARELPEELAARAKLSLERFFQIFEAAEKAREELDPADFTGWLLEESGLLGMYDGLEEEKVVRRENLRQLAAAVAEAAAKEINLEDFLDSVALLEEGESEGSEEGLRLMTLHSAKGLEFDVVFIGGLEDGLLPHANTREENAAIEEERRLLYVGMTRARRHLILSAARQRFLFGQRQGKQLSRFLYELPEDLFTRVQGESSGVTGAEISRGPRGFSQSTISRPGPSSRAPERQRKQGFRSKKIAPAVEDSDGVGWRPGEQVRHRKFGRGIILACQGRGPRLKLVVFFDGVGRKTLVPTIARLEKI